MSKICQFLQKRLGMSASDTTSSMMWRMLMTSSRKAAIHLGPIMYGSRKPTKTQNSRRLKSLFNITQKLVVEHSEDILKVKCLEYSSPSNVRSALARDQAVKWAKAAVCVYADSILCVGQVKHISGATARWKGPVEDLKQSSSYQDAVGVDGEAIEFEWHNFPGFSSLSILEEIRRELAGKKIQPEEFQNRIIFMSMCNDIAWSKGKNDENCIASQESRDEILARTLDVSASKIGRKVVWRFPCSERRVGFLSQRNGTAIQRNWLSCVEKCSQSSGELVSSIRLHRGRNGTSQFLCGQHVIAPCTFLISSHVNTTLIMLSIRRRFQSQAINKQVGQVLWPQCTLRHLPQCTIIREKVM